MSTTTETPERELEEVKIPAGDVAIGDQVRQGAGEKATWHAITGISAGDKSRWLELDGHERIRPRHTTMLKVRRPRRAGTAGNGETAAGKAELEERMKGGLRGQAAKTKAETGKGLKDQAAEAKAAREASSGAPSGPREGSMTSAMVTVLKRAKGPLTAREVTDRITKGPNPLAPGLKGKTPHQTVAAKLATEHKAKGLFKRVGRGQYTLREKA